MGVEYLEAHDPVLILTNIGSLHLLMHHASLCKGNLTLQFVIFIWVSARCTQDIYRGKTMQRVC